jgi:two-component system LytT family response regulator
MIRTILIDDEKSCTETLAIELEAYCPEVLIVGKYNAAKDGLLAIQSIKPNLVFLDIEMPWMNGFELLSSVGEINFDVIFVTAYDEFAIKAFKFNAVDYLLKPVQKDQLINAVQNVVKRNKVLPLRHLLEHVKDGSHKFEQLALPTMEGLIFLPISDILYCQSESNYTTVHKTDGSTSFVSKTLKSISEVLEEHSFFRIHQSYLVNLNYASKYLKGQGGEIVLTNGKHLPVARSKKDELLNKVGR